VSLLLPFLPGFININMKVCNKCNINKEDKEYYTYYHSTRKKFYTRHICLECTRLHARMYKQSNKGKIPQPVVPEVEPVILENQRRCKVCKEIKDMTEYYARRFQCITCVRKYENTTRRKRDEEYKMENGGSERIPQTPGVYADKYQKKQVSEFLILLGWKLNKNGVWSKEGFKDKNKVWLKQIKKYKHPHNSNYNGSERSPVYLKRDELIKLREDGLTFQKIGDIYGISPATALRIIKDKYEKK
jgi:hypothetical protein